MIQLFWMIQLFLWTNFTLLLIYHIWAENLIFDIEIPVWIFCFADVHSGEIGN